MSCVLESSFSGTYHKSPLPLSRNALRVAAVNTVGGSLLWVGKIALAALCGGFAFLMCDLPMYVDADRSTALSSPLFPVLFSAVFAYFIAAVFMNVRTTASRSILVFRKAGVPPFPSLRPSS
jgi:hypothetical protein